MKKWTLFLYICCTFPPLFGQDAWHFGLDFKHTLPLPILDNDFSKESTNKTLNVSSPNGYSFGGFIQRKILPTIAIESGIAIAKKRFAFQIADNVDNEFSINYYELPVLALSHIKMSRESFVYVSTGLNFQMLPSHLSTGGVNYTQTSLRYGWIRTGISASIGYEYRTKKDGSFLIGLNYSSQISKMYKTQIYFEELPIQERFIFDTTIENISIQVRYIFFNEKRKKSKVKQIHLPD